MVKAFRAFLGVLSVFDRLMYGTSASLTPADLQSRETWHGS
jgi:hypothetical protein